MENTQQLAGVVEHIVYRNEENGWTVLELADDDEFHKVVGFLPAIQVGESVTLSGEWVEHARFGRQFRAEAYEHRLPTDAESVFRYLASGAIKGIGPATAASIVEKFGADTLRVIEEEPEKLVKVRGITEVRAAKIAKAYNEQFGLREVILAFSAYGLTQSEALRCWKRWGSKTVDTVRKNPYCLCSSGLRIGFDRADRICMGMDRAPDDPDRVEAGIIHVLRHNLRNGHTCLPQDKLIAAAAQLLGIAQGVPTEILEDMIRSFAVRAEEIDGRPFVFLPDMYLAERYIASRIRLMTGFHTAVTPLTERNLETAEKKNNIHYQVQQRMAILAAIEKGVLILTGGPGTGKTTTLRAIIMLLEGLGERVEIAAPTGRAAKRIAELTGREARTIHRLLEVQWDENDTPVFDRNEKNPLDADALIVDEVSMVDVALFESLLRALRPGCRLILVGDTDQLPAVGAGRVLHDLIDSRMLPMVELTEVFRQALTSEIVANAHRIVKGDMPTLDSRKGDFFFLPQRGTEETAETVVDLCARRLPAGYGTSVFGDIQVLCPGRKGEIGTVRLNERLQEALNPPDTGKREWHGDGITLREGDKVMHIRNDYDIVWTRDSGENGTGVFNGDIGLLEKIDPREQSMQVRYEDRVAYYSFEQAQELELAYAITVHKSQGSEFDTVVLPLYRNPIQLCYRNLLYTAVTRAKKLLVAVGSRETVQAMVMNNKKTLRYTGLGHFLKMTESGFC